MSASNLPLKERVEKLERTLEELTPLIQRGSFKTIEDLEENIQKTIETELEKAKKELQEIKEKATREIGNIPGILDEMCQEFENEMGKNLTLLRKRIREL